jgi:hypothetical protein
MVGVDLPGANTGATTEFTTIQSLAQGDWVGIQSVIPWDSGTPAKTNVIRFFQVISVFHNSSIPATYTVWGFDGTQKGMTLVGPADTRVFRLLPSATT